MWLLLLLRDAHYDVLPAKAWSDVVAPFVDGWVVRECGGCVSVVKGAKTGSMGFSWFSSWVRSEHLRTLEKQ
eukprot:scaffold21007_cov85-Skeletonema_marinoi.AAC.1